MSSRKVLEKIEALERQLADLILELIKPKNKKSNRLVVGELVDVLNPSRGQENRGTISKINYVTGRATVDTKKGKVSRALKNLKRTAQE
jgi:hypothetical protein